MADNNDLEVIVGLKVPESVSRIIDDLRKVESDLAKSEGGKLKLIGRLNTDATRKVIERQLQSLKIDSNSLKITANLDTSFANGINNSLNQIKDSANQAREALGGIIKSTDNKATNITNIKDLEASLKGVGASEDQIKTITNRVKDLDISVEKLSYGFKKVGKEIQLTSLNATGFNSTGSKLSYDAIFDSIKKGGEKVFTGNWNVKLVESFEEIRKAEERLAKQTETTDKALESFAKLRGDFTVLNKKYSGLSDEGLGSSIKQQLKEIESLFNSNSNKFAKDSTSSLHEMRQAIIEVSNAIRALTVDVNNYEGTIDRSSQQTINGLRKQQEQAASFQRQIDTLKSKATDVNGSKPIEWKDGSALASAYEKATKAIETFGTASSQTYSKTKIDAQNAIEELKRLVDQTRNAEYAASSLRAKNFDTVKASTGSDIDKFVQKVQNALGSTKPLENEIKNIKKAFSELGDASPNDRIAKLTEVLNQLSNAGSRLDALKEVNKTYRDIERTMSRLDTVSGTSVFTKFSSNSEVVELQKRITQLRENYQKTLDVMRNNDVGSEQFKSALAVLDDLDAKFKVLITDTKAARTALNAESNSTSFVKQVNSLTASIKELQNTTTLTSSQKDALAGLLNRAELAQDKATIEQISAELVKLRGEIKQTGTESKNFDQISKSVEKVITDLDAMGRTQIFNTHSNNAGVIEFQDKIKGLSDTAKQVKADLNALGDSKAIPPELKTRIEELKQKFDELNGSNKTLQADLRQNDGWARTERQIQTLTARVKEYMATNTKASSKYKSQFEGLLSGLSTAEMNKDAEAVRRLTSNFQILRSQIKAAGDQGKTFGQTIVDNIKKFSSWMSLTSVVMRAWRSLKQMVTTVRELNTAMTAVIRVTQGTDSAYRKFFENAIKNAKELKMDLVDLINQSAEWAKRGYSLEEAGSLAKASGIYSVVADIDNATAVQHLTTVMKTYNMTVEESMDVTDKLDNIANRYAVTAGDLGEILSHSISSMQVAGNSLDQAIAMGTAIAQITGNANEAGSTLKVLSMRLRGASTELVNAGEDTEGMAESASKLREKIMALTNVNGKGGFDIMADADNFKSTYEIMEGISKVWKDISDVNQANKICLYVQKCA